MKKPKEVMTQLMNREITPNECKKHLPPCSNDDLEKLIIISQTPIKVRDNLTINDVSEMNFIEVRKYCKEKEKKEINLKDLIAELEIMWENGEITGFDYRYFAESADLEISKEFISKARSIGRFDK